MDQPGDNPRHSFVDPRLYNVVNAASNVLHVSHDHHQQAIDSWLVDKGKFHLKPLHYATRRPKSDVTIHAAKQALRNCLIIAEKLRTTQDQLRDNVETMSSAEWKQKTLDIGCLKDDFDKSMLVFEDNTVLKSLKGAVAKRQKKRRNCKKRRQLRQTLHRQRKEQQVESCKKIDAWLAAKREEVERVKTEEKMKRDADCVLDEVTKKKSDARKQLSLIAALVKLRTVRDSMATQRGEKPSLEDRKAFGCVTEKLIRMWEGGFQNYTKEEQCLKVMLEQNATMDTKAAVAAKQKRIADDWGRVLFGGDNPTPSSTFWALTSADRDLETFVAMRKSWDTFLAPTLGGAIPVGWVLPPDDVDERWSTYLHANSCSERN